MGSTKSETTGTRRTEKYRETRRAWYAKHKEERKAYLKKYNAENREELLAKKRAYNHRTKVTRLPRRLLSHARRRARKGGLPYNLTVADIHIPARCPALNVPLTIGKGRVHDGSPTLDRIVPDKGYTRGNVAVISSLANRIKNSGTWEQVAAVAQWLKGVSNSKNDNRRRR